MCSNQGIDFRLGVGLHLRRPPGFHFFDIPTLVAKFGTSIPVPENYEVVLLSDRTTRNVPCT